MTPRLLFRGLLLIASLVAIAYGVRAIGLDQALNERWIDAEVRGQGLAGEALFVGAALLFTAVGLPRQIVSFLGGYAFGLALGGALALVGQALGCAVTFFYSRLMGRSLVQAHFPRKVQRIDDFLSEHPFTMTLLIRLLPVGSNLATNLAAGVSRVPAARFLAGSAVGYVPQTIVFALVGSGVALDPGFRITLGVILFLVSASLGVHLYRRHRHGKSFDEDVDEVLVAEDNVQNDVRGVGENPR